MEKITAYKLLNGDIVEDYEEANRKNNAILLEKDLIDVINMDNDLPSNNKEIILYFIITNKNMIKGLLNKYL